MNKTTEKRDYDKAMREAFDVFYDKAYAAGYKAGLEKAKCMAVDISNKEKSE